MRRVILGAVAGAVVSLAFASPGLAADRVGATEPIHRRRHAVPSSRSLGKLGYDVTEGAIAPGRSGHRRHAGAGGRAARPRAGRHAARHGEHGERKARWPPGIPLADPTWGYDVFRPYALKPGAVPDDVLGRGRRRRRAGQPADRTTTPSRPRTRRWSSASSTASRSTASTSSPTRSPTNANTSRRRRQAGRDVPRRAARARVDLGRGRAPRLPVLPGARRRRRVGHPGDPGRRPRCGSSRS